MQFLPFHRQFATLVALSPFLTLEALQRYLLHFETGCESMSITAKYQRLFFQPQNCRVVSLNFSNGYQVGIVDGKGRSISQVSTKDGSLVIDLFKRYCQDKQVMFYDAQQQISRLRAFALLYSEEQDLNTKEVVNELECWHSTHCIMNDFSLLTGSHAMPLYMAMDYQGISMPRMQTLEEYSLASLNLIRAAVGFRPLGYQNLAAAV